MISFIVPVFNEENGIAPTIESLNEIAAESDLSGHEIIIVDDGSSDGTAACVADLAARYRNVVSLTHPVNLGVGSAIRTGLQKVSHPYFTIIPGDNDVPRELVRSLLAARGRADLIMVAPLNKEIRPLLRTSLSMIYQLFYLIVFETYVNYINGPGIWPTEKMRSACLRADGFSIIAEMNIKMLRSGCSFAEVPGYFRNSPKVRKTVTLRNFIEVVHSFLSLIYEIRVRSRDRFSGRPQRIEIEFLVADGKA